MLNILAGGIGALSGIIFFGLFAGPQAAQANGPILGYTITGEMLLMAVLSLPIIVVGAGLLKWRPWARSIGTVIAILEILIFPVGTVLGVYSLWVLMSEETDPLFSPRFIAANKRK